MVRHRVDADPDFHFDGDPVPDPDWHRHDANPYADPTSSFTHVGKQDRENFHCNASLQCFSIPIKAKGVTISIIVYSILKIFGKK